MEEAIINEASGFSFFRIILKYWYWILLIILLAPLFVQTFSESIKQHNYLYPVYKIGTVLVASDNVLYQQVELLKTDPDKLVGMVYPTSGIFKHVAYYWLFFINVIWAIFLDLHLLFLPWIVIYWIFKSNNSTTKGKNITYSVAIFLVFMFVINSIFTLDAILRGSVTITIPIELTPFQEFVFIAEHILPLHGVGNLIVYLVKLFIH